MNFIQGSCQRFSRHLRVPSTDCFKSIASHEKCIFPKNKVFYGPFVSVMRHNSSVLFHLKLYMLWTKGAHQNANFQTCKKLKLTKFLMSFFKPRVNFPLNFASPFSVITHNSYEIFLTETSHALDKKSPSKYNFSDFWVI